jgi:hypothetical protein
VHAPRIFFEECKQESKRGGRESTAEGERRREIERESRKKE